ncbi:MAG: tRNA (guanosine(37)-N1)-methyltransferase TrmD [Ferrimicrobium sp.]
MRISVVTIFPEMINSYVGESIIGRAIRSERLSVVAHDLRAFADDAHRSVDDSPYGGGPGMVLMAEPFHRLFESIDPPRPIIGMTPAGTPYRQLDARRLSLLEGFTLVCGRYEGVDARVGESFFDETLSVGDFVLAGGELAALCVIESVARLIPGVLGNEESPACETFSDSLVEYPHYTRPQVVRGRQVPEVLLSGDHQEIAHWRLLQSLLCTIERRPDLLVARGGLRPNEVELLVAHGYADLVDAIVKEQE